MKERANTKTSTKKHLLFICTAGMQRSPTAAELFERSGAYTADYAGIGPVGMRLVNQEMIDWADIIFVANEKEEMHASIVRERFALGDKPLFDLDIKDIYGKGSEELKELIRKRVSEHVAVEWRDDGQAA